MRASLWTCGLLLMLTGCDRILDEVGSRLDGVADGVLDGVLDGIVDQTLGGAPAGWTLSSHPCQGNRTDVMLWEGRTVWVGCGTTTTGYGLFRSTDAGRTWSAPPTSPAGFFDKFRVNSLQRADDGGLYVAGIHTEGAERVVRLDTSGSTATVEPVFSSTRQLWNSFHVGTFRRLSDGFAVAESLTGVELAFRTGDEAPWQDGYGWWKGGNGYQLLDLVVHDDRLYGAGSTISQPPTVFLPGSGDGFSAEPVALASFQGELWGIAVDSGGILTGGVDQNAAEGVVFWGPLDGRNREAWQSFRLSKLWPDTRTWVRGVCRSGDQLVAVGEFPARSRGLVLRSTNGGRSFSIIDPGDAPPLHRCAILEDGRLAVTGAEGWFGIYAR